MARPGGKYNRADSSFCVYEIVDKKSSHLEFMTLAEVFLQDGSVSPEMCHKHQEILLVNLGAEVHCAMDGADYPLEHYDVLYVPVDTPFTLTHVSDEPGHLYMYRADGEKRYEPFHAEWRKFSTDETRIRHLHKKSVYIMFDVGEKANKFIAGYTFYESFTRAFPPHNHTDQEEIYSFIEGNGAMEVYEDEERKTYVTSVSAGEHVTIPVMNYHPVFSQDEPLAFFWCIAGERYWVGDKNQDFMKGGAEAITT